MDEKRRFQDLLAQLVELAAENDNILDKETVESHFAELGLSQSLYPPIYDYLKNHKILVAGVHDARIRREAPKDDYALPEDFDITKEESKFLDMYYADLKKAPVYDTDALLAAIADLQTEAKKTQAVSLLTEAHLSHVVTVARAHTRKGVSLGDLIQEGNLAMMQAIPDYNGAVSIEEFQQYITRAAAAGMQTAINEQIGAERISRHLADQANYLDEASRNLSKELGREPTLEELAEYTHLDESEVHNILKQALDALNASEE